jgi:predicted transcriptional regulator
VKLLADEDAIGVSCVLENDTFYTWLAAFLAGGLPLRAHRHIPKVVSLTGPTYNPTLAGMEVHLTPEQQQLLAELAAQRGRDADALAQEAISRYLAEEARFVEAVKHGESALERGDYLTHEQVGERLNRLFRS